MVTIMTIILGVLSVVFLGGIMLLTILSGIPLVLDAIIEIVGKWRTLTRRNRGEDKR